ncbi:C-X-C chemokine receptor type 5 isoform X1 [Hippopotamus amphibius kiboko]|uniref:C-X-C chemokine receptor type 5 isoform X1 n=1 Tax=Hippopotamus amphibius kiboko TaxID=575201 RepID=UPI0025964185|nr:C-X-C chemokine receptor type 5 isoform X1 [Hippopotamus amphibius kiboko]
MNYPLTLDMDLMNYNLEDLSWEYKELGSYNDSTEIPTMENHLCSTAEGPLLTSFKAVFMPVAYGLIFLLGMMGNILVLVILERHRQTRSSTETFLFHLAVADLLLVFILPFAVAEGSMGWVLGTFLCKTVISLHKINFYCSSLLLACIAVDRYLAIVHAVHAYRHRRLLSIHITCATIWLAGFFFALPEILFAKVSQPHYNDSLPRCTFSQENHAETNAWFTSRFLYHIGGFLLPMLVMAWCYVGVVHRLCQAQRRPQRQKAVRVAILVTSVFFLCWSPYHIVIFLDTLARLKALGNSCELNGYLSVAITMSEFLGLAHCCLNPMLYTFAGVKFRSDLSRLLTKLGCAGPASLCQLFPSWRKSSLSESENATSLTTF